MTGKRIARVIEKVEKHPIRWITIHTMGVFALAWAAFWGFAKLAGMSIVNLDAYVQTSELSTPNSPWVRKVDCDVRVQLELHKQLLSILLARLSSASEGVSAIGEESVHAASLRWSGEAGVVVSELDEWTRETEGQPKVHLTKLDPKQLQSLRGLLRSYRTAVDQQELGEAKQLEIRIKTLLTDVAGTVRYEMGQK